MESINNNNNSPKGKEAFKSKLTLTVVTCKEVEEPIVNPTGCKHYKRRCQKRCPECEEFFTCRLCHDDVKYHNEWDPKKCHMMKRHEIKEIKCLNCYHI